MSSDETVVLCRRIRCCHDDARFATSRQSISIRAFLRTATVAVSKLAVLGGSNAVDPRRSRQLATLIEAML
jgi:hypothetical protein